MSWATYTPASTRAANLPARSLDRTTAAASLLGAQALHAAALPEHLREWVWAGVFFAVLAIAEWALAWTVLTRPDSRIAGIAIGAVAALTIVGVLAPESPHHRPMSTDETVLPAVSGASAPSSHQDLP